MILCVIFIIGCKTEYDDKNRKSYRTKTRTTTDSNTMTQRTPCCDASLQCVVIDPFPQHNDQLEVELESLSCHGHECDQKEVL